MGYPDNLDHANRSRTGVNKKNTQSRRNELRARSGIERTAESCLRTTDRRESPEHERLVESKTGMEINGTLKYNQWPKRKRADTGHVYKVFLISGVYRERSLTAYYRSEDRRSTSSGCLTLRLDDDNRMTGGCVYYDGDVHEVVTDEYAWTRVK